MTATVVKLPTAARRRVDNNRFADQRRAVVALRAAEPWPGEYIIPKLREERKVAEALARLERTPEMFAILAMMTAFPGDRLASLAGAANLILARDNDSEADKLGYALVSEAIALLRTAEMTATVES